MFVNNIRTNLWIFNAIINLILYRESNSNKKHFLYLQFWLLFLVYFGKKIGEINSSINVISRVNWRKEKSMIQSGMMSVCTSVCPSFHLKISVTTEPIGLYSLGITASGPAHTPLLKRKIFISIFVTKNN